jgi:hypothetical protein
MERFCSEEVSAVDLTDHPVGREYETLLHEEINRLPPRFRTPIILCDLEGLSPGVAARQLGWSPGRFERRLLRARKHLQAHMDAKGIDLPFSRGIAGLLVDGKNGVSRRLIESTVAAAWRRRGRGIRMMDRPRLAPRGGDDVECERGAGPGGVAGCP